VTGLLDVFRAGEELRKVDKEKFQTLSSLPATFQKIRCVERLREMGLWMEEDEKGGSIWGEEDGERGEVLEYRKPHFILDRGEVFLLFHLSASFSFS